MDDLKSQSVQQFIPSESLYTLDRSNSSKPVIRHLYDICSCGGAKRCERGRICGRLGRCSQWTSCASTQYAETWHACPWRCENTPYSQTGCFLAPPRTGGICAVEFPPTFRLQKKQFKECIGEDLLTALVVSTFVKMPGIFRWTELCTKWTSVACRSHMFGLDVLPQPGLVFGGPEAVEALPQLSYFAHSSGNVRLHFY